MKKLSSMLALGLAAAMVFGMTVSAAESPNTSTTITPSTTVDDSIVNSVVNASDEQAGSQVVATQVTGVVESLPTLGSEEKAAYTEAAKTHLNKVDTTKITTNLKDSNGTAVAVTTKAVEPEVVAAAPKAAAKVVEQLASKGVLQVNSSKVEVKAGVDISLPANVEVSASNPVTVAIPVDIAIQSNKTYIVLHMVADGQWETVKATIVNGTIYGTFTKLSPVLVVEADAVKAGNNDDGDDDDDDNGVVTLANGTVAPASPKTDESIPVAGMMAVICLAGAAACAVKVRYSK